MKQRASTLASPPIDPEFEACLDELVALCRQGHRPDSPFYNPPDEWLIQRMPIFQDLAPTEQERVLEESKLIHQEGKEANAASRAWPDLVMRLDNGGLAFFSQLGVVRRPDLTKYFIDGFDRNRNAQAVSEKDQVLIGEVMTYIVRSLKRDFSYGDNIVQTDRQICDAPGRSYHARQLLFGTKYLQLPYMWRQLTFDLPQHKRQNRPDIIELTIPRWLEDLRLPKELKGRILEAGMTQLVFKAPTRGLSLHLGFDYVGEHKMGPLSIAMFLTKQKNGLALQAALSMARIRTINGNMTNTALVTVGPSLHGKSTLTIMIELANSDLARLLGLVTDPDEGLYPMNDDIVLLQPLPETIEVSRGGNQVRFSYGIDGTENNFYAVPHGLTRDDDPITYDVLRGTDETPNSYETLENVPVDPEDGTPDYLHNPVKNARMILSRRRLLDRKGVQHLLEAITKGRVNEAVHVPLEDTDRVAWQAVMRQNTVIPPLRRLTLEQYVRVLMYGEAIEMGAAAGTIGRPYVEYFSDPFIIGLEDENANLLHYILQQMGRGGLLQEFWVFNTGGVGADSDKQASGQRYRKIPRELTLILQEALLRGAVKTEYDSTLGSDVAVAILNSQGDEIFDLRNEWLPRQIYGDAEYRRRVGKLRHRRYYGHSNQDKAGILRYTKVTDSLFDLTDIPPPNNERELAWLLSFYWHVDQTYDSLPQVARHRTEGRRPPLHLLRAVTKMYEVSTAHGLTLTERSERALRDLGVPEPHGADGV